MDSTPPSLRSEPRLPSKSASRLARMVDFSTKIEPTHLNLDLTDSPKLVQEPPSPQNSTPLRDLLLLSPSPRKPRTRIVEKSEIAEEPVGLIIPPRRRCKNRGSPMGAVGCASPRNNRRTRRRIDPEDRDLGVAEENPKPRKRKQTLKSRKEKLSLAPSVPSSSQRIPETLDEDQSGLDNVNEVIWDLIMWKDVAKSTLWFGFVALCLLSSCFTRDYRYSVITAISQVGLMFLAVSFFYNSFSLRNPNDPKLDFKLTEGDILRMTRVCLPVVNLVIAKIRELFSGEPSTTLKVAPFLLVGAEFGHLITLWRLYAFGFFISFTLPKLYSCYSLQISTQVEYVRNWVSEAWEACAHKKIVTASAAIVFWNLSSIKTRIFLAFISVVILRYYRQQSGTESVEGEGEAKEEVEQSKDQALVVVQNIAQKS